jgi:ATP-binding cassette subfamily F protein uup
VLLLDEPTNDLDIETLTALADLLDSWPGTLVVVSHDRYFVERVTDNVYGLMGDGKLTHLPRGIEQYLGERHGETPGGDQTWAAPSAAGVTPGAQLKADRKETRRLEKEQRRVERELGTVTAREQSLHLELVEASTDFARLSPLQAELVEVTRAREQLEAEWLELGEALELRP